MDMITPIGPGAGNGAGGTNSPVGATGAVDGATPGGQQIQVTTTTSSDTMVRMSQVQQSVGGMLQAIGGGLENDKMLKLVIALMILTALLDDSKQEEAGSSGGLNGQAGGQSIFFGQFSSSTTVEMHQSTSTTISIQSPLGPDTTDGAGDTPPGSELDISA